jgi:succinoglycan biosynthesis transport protein ExoP
MTRSVRDMEELPPEGTLDLQEFLASMRRRKWLVLAVTLLVTGLAALYSFTRTPMYTTSANVLLKPVLAAPLDTSASDQISLPTEIRVATSASVADIARQLIGSSSPGVPWLLDHVSVTAPEEAQILEIAYSDSDPGMAQAGAQAFADAYLQFKRQQALATIASHSSTVRAEIEKLDQEMTKLSQAMAAEVPRTAPWQELLEQRRARQTTRVALKNELVTLNTLSVDGGQVIQRAEFPPGPATPRHRVDTAIGLLLGLAAGVVLASASERLRDRIQSRDDLEECLEATVLGVIPKVSARKRRPARLATIDEPRGLAAESYRTLRTNFLAVNSRPPVKTVLVTSAGRGEGKTTVAATLAAALAQLGKEVVLISGDLRHPRVHALFGMDNDRGLGQVLTGEAPLSEALRHASIPFPYLRVLPSGPVMGILDPVDLLQSNRMLDILVQCSVADFVLIDSAPILDVADSLVLAEMVDGIVFVADAQKGNRAAVVQARDQLRQVRGRVLGGVLKGYDPRRGRRRLVPHDTNRGVRHRLLVSEPVSDGKYSVGEEVPGHQRSSG